MNRRQTMVISAAAAAAALFGASAFYYDRSGRNAQVGVGSDSSDVYVRPHSPVIGQADAPVTIVEFFDPACEACRAFHPIVKDIMAEHGEAVRVVIRYTPFHGAASEEAIRVLEAARMQDVYMPVLEAVLREQPRWASHGAPAPGLILQVAATAGLDAEAARSQMLAPGVVAILNQDRADVETVGIRQTPTFFVNGKPLDPFGEAELRRLVAAEVASAQK